MASMLVPEYKVVMLGSGGVGKSMLTTKYMNGNFSDEYDPTIEDSYRKQCTVDNTTCILEILDTAGQEEYAAMRDYHIRSGDCFVVVYSVASMETLHEAASIAKKIFLIKETDHVPIVLVGNKCDLPEREVSMREGMDLARRIRSGFYEASARENIRVQDVFTQCVRRIKRLRKEAGPHSAGLPEAPPSQFASHHLKQSRALSGTRSWIQRRKSNKNHPSPMPDTHQSLPEYYMSHHSVGPSQRLRSNTEPLSPAKRKTLAAQSPGPPRRRSSTRGATPGASRARELPPTPAAAAAVSAAAVSPPVPETPASPPKDTPLRDTIRVVPLGHHVSDDSRALGNRPITRGHAPHRRSGAADSSQAAKRKSERPDASAAAGHKLDTNKELPRPRHKPRFTLSSCAIL